MSGSQQLLLGGSVQQAVDPYFYSVTSLLHGDGTNGGQNNTFLDSSSNNFTITRNGNTTQGSFSPFSQTGWGLYQPAVPSDYLNFTTSAGTLFQFTGDYTIEAWVFPTVLGSDTSIWVTNDGSANYHAFNIDATNYNIYLNSGSPTSSFSHGLQVNQWNHVAMVRNGSTITVYTNGVSRGTITNSSTNGYSSPTLARIGGGAAGSSRYLSNLRIVKGTAVYTAAFTPPTTPLTAISGTSLLTCQANRFLDASSNALVATVTGSPSVQPFSPFNPTTAYSTSAVGGSGYFDGSGDYLTVASNSVFNIFNQTNATVEFWFNPSAYTTDQDAICYYVDGNNFWMVQFAGGQANKPIKFYTLNAGVQVSLDVNQSSTAFLPNQWNHCAFVKSGSTWSSFINGSRVATAGTAPTINFTGTFYIGSRNTTTNLITGYLAGVRITNTVEYSGTTYTVPTAPLTAISGTGFLTNFTNGAIFDNAADADYETVGNAQISTSVKKYGTGSMAFDGSGDRLVGAPIQTRAPGTGDFCYEFWFYANTSSNACLFDTRAVNNNTTGFACLLNGSSQIALYTNSTILTCGLALSASIWYHIAVTRTAGVIKVFVNGTVVGTLANTSNFSDRTLQLGQYIDSTGSLNGYIDDFRSSNGVGRYAYNFTPPTAEFPNIGGTVTLTADPYFDYTTLLLPGNGTNGAQNNTFLDSSTNAFTITRNGNTTQGTFSPFSQTGWGNYFNFGTPDALRPSATGISNFGTGAFTIEFWISFQNTSPAGIYYGGTTGSIFIDYFSGSLRLGISGGSIPISYAFTPAVGIWYHVAFVRSSTTDTLYINGTSVATGSDSQNYPSDSGPYVGSWNGGTYTGAAYLSNVRVVKGTAVYTANFTPSTTPLTAISGTSLLTCQSNRFIDNSTNAFAITTSGSPTVQAFSPFNPTAAWSAATNGGSGYFDGSGDYLTAAGSTSLTFGTGDFTVEGWFYTASPATNMGLFQISTTAGGLEAGNTNNVAVYCSSSVLGVYYNDTFKAGTTAIRGSSWTHFALVRSSGTDKLYVNGVADSGFGSSADTRNYTGGNIAVGGYFNTSYLWNGYISGFRVVKGTAVYTTDFTPPTAPPTTISNTQFLLNYTNAGIYDATSKNDLETVGNAQISTTQSKFGGSSMYFDGTGDYLYKPSDAITAISGDFTIEAWVYRNTTTTHPIVDVGDYSLSTGILFYINNTNALAVFTNNASLISGGTIAATTWTHVAVVRYGSTVSLYVNGTTVGTPASNTASFSGRLQVGADFYTSSVTNYLNGYIDDLRITRGIARYTSNFTPPSTPFLTL